MTEFSEEKKKFLKSWQARYEGRNFDFQNPQDQEEYLQSLIDLGQYIAHTARTGRHFTITTEDGISTVYLKVEN